MKKTLLVSLCTVILASSFTGCSTKRYGRLQDVSKLERENLTCKQIEIEIEKSQDFLDKAAKRNDKFDGKYVLGILGDFGIGNIMEYKEAKKSAKNRLVQLREIQKEKACNQ